MIGLDNVTGKLDNSPFLQYLYQNWDLLAAYAYEQYLAKRRGALFVDWCCELPLETPLTEVGIVYVERHKRILKSFFPSNLKKLDLLLREYDPQEQIVVFWYDGEFHRFRTVKLLGAMTPKEAYSAMQGRMIEFKVDVALSPPGRE